MNRFFMLPFLIALSTGLMFGCDDDNDKPTTDGTGTPDDGNPGTGTPDEGKPGTDGTIIDSSQMKCIDGNPVAIELLRSDSNGSGHEERGYDVIYTEDDLAKAQLNSDRTIDFSKEYVMVIYAGMRSTGGYQIAVTGACAGDDSLQVYAVVESCKDAMVTEAVTYPQAVLVVPKATDYDLILTENRFVCDGYKKAEPAPAGCGERQCLQ